MKPKIYPIIQARMDSTRLPGKTIKKIGNCTMLSHVVRQTKASKFVDDVIIATTNSKNDKKIVDFCIKNNLSYFCGSKNDVLDRYYQCAKKFSCDPIVRISSDCPFIDPDVIDKVISKFLKNSYDYVSNNYEKIQNKYENSLCNFPQGMVVEISTFKTLEKAWKKAKKPSEREHVFPYVQFNSNFFNIANIKNQKNLSLIRCTVDKIEDLKFVNKIWTYFPKSKKIIHIDDIVSIVSRYPKLLKINDNISFDEGYKKSIKLDNKHYIKNSKKNMKTCKFLFIVDGNNKIGLGHVYRSINLANYLSKNNHNVLFLTTEKIAHTIISDNHRCKLIHDLTNTNSKKIIKMYDPNLIILDKLTENKTNLKTLKQYAKITAIDYVGKHQDLIDYGINFLYPRSEIKNSFSGFQYSILNKEFVNGEKYRPKKKVKSILALQGGADTYCFLPKIVTALDRIKSPILISVVVGPSFRCWPKLKKTIALSSKKIKILSNVKNMHKVMKNHDMAVTAAGNTVLELACTGIPSVILCGERFENETAKILTKNQFGINLGFGKDVSEGKILDEVKRLMINYDLRRKMSSIGKTLVDGKGSKRIVTLLEGFCRQK